MGTAPSTEEMSMSVMDFMYEDDDFVDFDEVAADPRVAAATEDAEERFELIAKLVAARKAAGMTQKQVAKAMSTTQSFVSDFENGHTDPHLSTYQRYARAVDKRVVSAITEPAASMAERSRETHGLRGLGGWEEVGEVGTFVCVDRRGPLDISTDDWATARASRRADFCLSA